MYEELANFKPGVYLPGGTEKRTENSGLQIEADHKAPLVQTHKDTQYQNTCKSQFCWFISI
jgi:hypothetical protein